MMRYYSALCIFQERRLQTNTSVKDVVRLTWGYSSHCEDQHPYPYQHHYSLFF